MALPFRVGLEAVPQRNVSHLGEIERPVSCFSRGKDPLSLSALAAARSSLVSAFSLSLAATLVLARIKSEDADPAAPDDVPLRHPHQPSGIRRRAAGTRLMTREKLPFMTA